MRLPWRERKTGGKEKRERSGYGVGVVVIKRSGLCTEEPLLGDEPWTGKVSVQGRAGWEDLEAYSGL